MQAKEVFSGFCCQVAGWGSCPQWVSCQPSAKTRVPSSSLPAGNGSGTCFILRYPGERKMAWAKTLKCANC